MRTAIALIFLSSILSMDPPPVVAAEAAAERVMIVLDASGSMWGRVGNETKIEIARGVIRDLLADWQPGVQLGLSAYGHRRKGDCQDIETLIPVQDVQPEAVIEIVNGIVPRGKTPLSQAVRLAAEELKFSEEAATVILVSDGRETCRADPCALGRELEKTGVDFTTHVIGFDVGAEDSAGLECLAEATGGEYHSANDAASLLAALRRAVEEVKVPEPPKERTRSFPIQSGCQGSGLVCEPEYPIEVTTQGVLKARFRASSIHCGSIQIGFSLDGQEVTTSEFLAAGGQDPTDTELVDFGLVEPGVHTLGLRATAGQGGCIVDSISSWAGTVTLWWSE